MRAHVHSACVCLLHVCVSSVCARDHPRVLNRGGQASAGGAQPPPCARVTPCHPLCPQGSSASGRRTGACSTTPACTEAPARATPASALRATLAPTASTVSVGTWGGTGDTLGTRGNMPPVPITLSPAGTALSELDRDWQEGSGGGGMVPRGAVHPFSPFLNPKPMLVRGCSVVPSHPISPQMPLGSSVPLSVTAPTWPCPATSSPAGEWR